MSCLQDVEEEFYGFLGQIEFEDISGIELYWDTLKDSLLNIDFLNDWEKPIDPNSSFSEVLASLPGSLVDVNLQSLVEEMEEICQKSSSDTISKEEMKSLQEKATIFEKEFTVFIERIADAEP